MNSRSIVSLAALALGFALSTSGCASVRKPTAVRHTTPIYALAVTVVGGQQPTAVQWAALRDRFSRALAARGLVLVNDIGLADQVIMVELASATDGSSLGTATVTGIEPNVLSYASVTQPSTVYPTSYGYLGAFATSPWPGYTTYNGTIYGYTDPYAYWNDYNSGGGYTVVPNNPVTPPSRPNHEHPDHPDHPDRPDHPNYPNPWGPIDHHPWDGDRPGSPPNYVHDHPHPTPPSDGHPSWPGRDDSRPVYTRSEPTYSRSDSTYSPPAASSSSSSDYSSSSSSSDSAPSYSPPVESSSPSSYSGPTSGGLDSARINQN